MATRGRKPNSSEPLTAAERKARFDAKMRNEDGRDPGAPARKAVVIYLSDEARGVLRRHRFERQLLGQSVGPRLDSELVEQLLLAMLTPNEEGGSSSVDEPMHADISTVRAKTVAKLKEMRRQLRHARQENQPLRERAEKLKETQWQLRQAREEIQQLHRHIAELQAGGETEKQIQPQRGTPGVHEDDAQSRDSSKAKKLTLEELMDCQRSRLWLWAPRFLADVREIMFSEAGEPQKIHLLARVLDEHIDMLFHEQP